MNFNIWIDSTNIQMNKVMYLFHINFFTINSNKLFNCKTFNILSFLLNGFIIKNTRGNNKEKKKNK